MLKTLPGPHLYSAERLGVWKAHAITDPKNFKKDVVRVLILRDAMPTGKERVIRANCELVHLLGNMLARSVSEWTPNVQWTLTPRFSPGYQHVWVEFIRQSPNQQEN